MNTCTLGAPIPRVTNKSYDSAIFPAGIFDPVAWLAEFESVGGGFAVTNSGPVLCFALGGRSAVEHAQACALTSIIRHDPRRMDALSAAIAARSVKGGASC